MTGVDVSRSFIPVAVASLLLLAACSAAPTSGPANGYGMKPMYQASRTKDGREFYFTRCSDAMGCLKIASAYCTPGIPVTYLDPYESESAVPGFFRDDEGTFAKLVCKK
ncbi:hypothetical protein BH09PSE6_BH09PSE6_32420 [soil metagenome]